MKTRMLKGLALVVSLGFAGAAQATAPAADLNVRRIELAGTQGNTARVNLFLAKRGAGQTQERVKIFLVNGAQRREVWSGDARFAAGRDGFLNQVNVNLGGPIPAGARLEVVASEPGRDSNFGDNTGNVSLGGGDLFFDGAPRILERAGGNPNREISIKVKNRGPAPIPAGCKVRIQLTENGSPINAETRLPALANGGQFEIKRNYNFRSSNNPNHNNFTATIECSNDNVDNNNSLRTRLR